MAMRRYGVMSFALTRRLARAPFRYGVLALALGAVPALAQTRPSDQAVPQISQALQTRQFATALELAAAALRGAPQDPRLWTLQAIAQSSLGKTTEALGSFRHALRIAPRYLPAMQGAAQLAYSMHDPSAPELLTRLLAQNPQDANAHAMLAVVQFHAGNCADAAEHFQQAGAAVGAEPEALTEWSSCLVRLGRFEDAVPVFQRMLELHPESDPARYDLALAQRQAGHPADALATLGPLLTAERPRGDTLTLAAEAAEAAGETQQALTLLRRAVLLEPKNRDAYLDFANIAYQHQSMQVGLDMLGIGLKQLPDDAHLLFARGVLLCQEGKLDAGLADLDRANQLDPALSAVGVAQGIAASQSHNSSVALAKFREQVRAHPNDPLAQYLLAEALSELGKPPGSPEFEEEVAAAKAAVRLDPKKVEAHDLLASSYLQAGDTVRSIAESRAALAADPKDQQALYHLMLALKRTDHREEIPSLLTRLMQAREEAQKQTEQSRPHTLVEASGPG